MWIIDARGKLMNLSLIVQISIDEDNNVMGYDLTNSAITLGSFKTKDEAVSYMSKLTKILEAKLT